jgi:hypothetical protein
LEFFLKANGHSSQPKGTTEANMIWVCIKKNSFLPPLNFRALFGRSKKARKFKGGTNESSLTITNPNRLSFTQRQSTLSNPIMWQFEKENVPAKLFFLTLFWEFVMFFQLSTSFHYSAAKQFHYELKNMNSRSKSLKNNKFWPRSLIFQSIMKLFGCRIVQWCGTT